VGCTQLAEGGSLHNRLYSRSGARRTHWQTQQQQPTGAIGGSSRASLLPPPLSMREVLSIACDIASAMLYLHSLPVQVVHRDLKPQNVLLDLQGNAKVRWRLCVCVEGRCGPVVQETLGGRS
jgi:serine/threonine protein kinase